MARRERAWINNISSKTALQPDTLDIPLGTDKLEHGIDYNDSEDDIFGLENDTLEGEEDGVDSFGEYTKNEALANRHGDNMDQILSIRNLPGYANYGLESSSGSHLSKRKMTAEVGVQVDLQDA